MLRFSRPLGAVTVVGVASAYFFYPSPSRGVPTNNDRPLSAAHFTPSTVVSTDECDPQTRLITLAVPPDLIPNGGQLSAIWSVFIKDDDIQVERPYTPLEGIDEKGRMKFWVKQYRDGEVGRWLHSKRVGNQVELRGPLQTWLWQEDDDWDDVVMISGGTGITPFYQLFHSYISRNPTSRTRFTLLHSSRTLGELPPASMLQPLLQCPNLDVHLFVDELPSNKALANAKIHVGRIGRDAIEESVGMRPSWWQKISRQSPTRPNRRTLLLVCGPEPMICAIAGPYGRNYSQGPIGGILGELGFSSAEIRKL